METIKKEEKHVKTFLELENEAAEQLSTFIFIVFVPNPLRHNVHIWIDGGEFETYMETERFLSIIETTCGNPVRIRLENACHEYGVPFMYDRHENKLKELTEMPQQQKHEWSADYHKQYENQNNNPYSVDNLFKKAMEASKGVNNYGLPNFDSPFLKN